MWVEFGVPTNIQNTYKLQVHTQSGTKHTLGSDPSRYYFAGISAIAAIKNTFLGHYTFTFAFLFLGVSKTAGGNRQCWMRSCSLSRGILKVVLSILLKIP